METFGGCGPGNYAGRQIASIRIPRNQNLGSSSKRSQPRARQPQRFVWPIFVINSITKSASLQSGAIELIRQHSISPCIASSLWGRRLDRSFVPLSTQTELCNRIRSQLPPSTSDHNQKQPCNPDKVASIKYLDVGHVILPTNGGDK